MGFGTPPEADKAAVAAAIDSLNGLASSEEPGPSEWKRWTCPACGRSWMVQSESELTEELWRCPSCSPTPGSFRAGDLVRVRGPDGRKHYGVVEAPETAATRASAMASTSLIQSRDGPYTGQWRVYLTPAKLPGSGGWPDIGSEGEVEVLNSLPLDRKRRVRLCTRLMAARVLETKRIHKLRRSERARLFPDLYR